MPRKLLFVAAIITAVSTLAGGCSSRSDDSASSAPPSSDAPDASASQRPGSGSTSTPTPLAQSATPRDEINEPGATSPPKAGTYRYREVTDGKSTEARLRIVDRDGGRKTEIEGDSRSEVVWRSDSKRILETTFGGSQNLRCDWKPDLIEYKLPLEVGTTWELKGSCTPTRGLTIEFRTSSRVVEANEVRVAGQTVRTWAIHSEGTSTFRTSKQKTTQNSTTDAQFSPKHGLSVRSRETVTGTDPSTGRRINEVTTRELLNLEPD